MRLSLAIVAILLVVTQTVPERSLPPAPEEFRESFTGVGSIRELGDVRVLVVDREDKVVRLVDLTRGTAAPVGRQGGGPGEYNRPFRLLPLGGDTTLQQDRPTRFRCSASIVGPDGWTRSPASGRPSPTSSSLAKAPGSPV